MAGFVDALRAARRGREIDKADGMLLLFESAADAASYALDYHRGLGALPVPLTARVGLHVGPAVLTRNSDADVALGAKALEVDGIAKPIAGRLMALAGSRQTLVTGCWWRARSGIAMGNASCAATWAWCTRRWDAPRAG